jgi:Nuclease-related domain
MTSQSPLKAKPLPNPGDSIDREIQRMVDDKLVEVFFFAGGFSLVALMEWIGYLTRSPRHPALFTGVALVACIVGAWRVWQIRGRLKQLRLGRDGERCVGQFLERLRDGGGRVFHDIPAPGFNLDHVIISSHGLFAVETKTFSKPSPRAAIAVETNTLLVAGRRPDRNPMEQAAGTARWLEDLLESSTGKKFPVRAVVVFPGWFVEQRAPRGPVWVLEPKALPAFIEKEPENVLPGDVALASFHLSRYLRNKVNGAA